MGKSTINGPSIPLLFVCSPGRVANCKRLPGRVTHFFRDLQPFLRRFADALMKLHGAAGAIDIARLRHETLPGRCWRSDVHPGLVAMVAMVILCYFH